MLTVDDILTAIVREDLSQVDEILYTWRFRRNIDNILERKKIDYLCKCALRSLEHNYPGKVWPKLTNQESDLIDYTH